MPTQMVEVYAKRFSLTLVVRAVNPRWVIKHKLQLTDEETLPDISKKPRYEARPFFYALPARSSVTF